jgi:hypothetical protein
MVKTSSKSVRKRNSKRLKSVIKRNSKSKGKNSNPKKLSNKSKKKYKTKSKRSLKSKRLNNRKSKGNHLQHIGGAMLKEGDITDYFSYQHILGEYKYKSDIVYRENQPVIALTKQITSGGNIANLGSLEGNFNNLSSMSSEKYYKKLGEIISVFNKNNFIFNKIKTVVSRISLRPNTNNRYFYLILINSKTDPSEKINHNIILLYTETKLSSDELSIIKQGFTTFIGNNDRQYKFMINAFNNSVNLSKQESIPKFLRERIKGGILVSNITHIQYQSRIINLSYHKEKSESIALRSSNADFYINFVYLLALLSAVIKNSLLKSGNIYAPDTPEELFLAGEEATELVSKNPELFTGKQVGVLESSSVPIEEGIYATANNTRGVHSVPIGYDTYNQPNPPTVNNNNIYGDIGVSNGIDAAIPRQANNGIYGDTPPSDNNNTYNRLNKPRATKTPSPTYNSLGTKRSNGRRHPGIRKKPNKA